MADISTIARFLQSTEWTTAEKWVVKWQFRLLGDFETALANAIKLADENNLAKLKLGFPIQVNGFLRWHSGDLGKRLRDAGLDI